MMKINIVEIAKVAEVTPATVSYVLNNKWKEKRISEEVRDKISKIAKDLDYHPNIPARGLVTNRTQTIGVAVYSIEYLTEMYFGTIMQGIAHQVGLHNYRIQFTVTDETVGDSARNLSFKKNVKEKSLDGLIIIDQSVPDKEILWLKERNVPFVLVDRDIPNENIFCVRVNNREGIYVATEHLIKQGHKRIAFVNEGMKWNKLIGMFEGYYQALGQYGISVDKELIIEAANESIPKRLESILRIEVSPTAIVCSNDVFAVQIVKILREMEIRVPQDMALVGYNDDPNFAHVEPQLTTVRLPLREMGEESAKMLFSLINGVVPEKSEVILEPTLIVRQSTKRSVLSTELVKREQII